jgi:glycogen debranching enzyme
MTFVAENALDWLLEQLRTSASGLLEYKRRNPHGIENQVWKDSREFYVHENKMLANHEAGIASIEVQGLAYDGLIAAAKLLPTRSKEAAQAAVDLRTTTLKLLWQPKRRYFALGTDYDQLGKLRIIKTLTANPAAMLDSGFFDTLTPPKRQEYITSLVRMIMSPEFLTDGGIRSRALSQAHLIPFWDYHGSYTSWPKETYDIAKGLQRQGFPLLARELENRLLNVIFKAREYLEFVYVDEWGRVLAGSPSSREHGEFTLVDSTNKPERIQAWTVSAVLAIFNYRLSAKLNRPKSWRGKSWRTYHE